MFAYMQVLQFGKDLSTRNIIYYLMRTDKERFIEIFSRFIQQFTQGIENFTYKGKDVGSGIFLISFIGSREDCFMKDIIQYLNVIPSTATRRVDKLEKLGLIIRSNSDDDRRLIRITLSDEGKELHSAFLQRKLMGVDLMMKEFEESELNIFFKILEKIMLKSKEMKNNLH